MKKGEIKYFWLYACVLFIIACVLIVFAAKFQNDSLKDLENQLNEKEEKLGSNESMISAIQDINERLSSKNKELEDRIALLEDRYKIRSEELLLQRKQNDAMSSLLYAQLLYSKRSYSQCLEELERIDKENIPIHLRAVYDDLYKKVKR